MILHNPQYVGFWKRGGETEETFVPQSFFLMFVEGEGTEDNWKSREITGSIQDSYGNAYFKGNLINNHIEFEKYYLVLANEESPFLPFEKANRDVN